MEILLFYIGNRPACCNTEEGASHEDTSLMSDDAHLKL
jgi:hypothetical protein